MLRFGEYNGGAAITAQTQSAKAAMKLVTYFEFYLAKSDNKQARKTQTASLPLGLASRLALPAQTDGWPTLAGGLTQTSPSATAPSIWIPLQISQSLQMSASQPASRIPARSLAASPLVSAKVSSPLALSDAFALAPLAWQQSQQLDVLLFLLHELGHQGSQQNSSSPTHSIPIR